MLKAKYLNLYKKSDGNGGFRTVFRFLLSGTAEMLKRYEDILTAQSVPVHRDEDSGQIIYFTTTYQGDIMNVDITANDKIVVINDTVEKLESKLNLVQDPTLKQAMAARIADMILGTASAGAAPVAAASQVVASEESETVEEEDTDM